MRKSGAIKNFAFRLGILIGLLTLPLPAMAATLYGVTGDQAKLGNPFFSESLFSVSKADASTTFIQALGNGNDGESIAFNPMDGLMYHWSGNGLPNQILETINLTTQAVTNIPVDFAAYAGKEVLGSTYDAANNVFLVTDLNDRFSSVTPGGVFTTISQTPCSFGCRGLAFNGGILYAGDLVSDLLFALNPLTGGGLSSINVTLAGFTVKSINGLSTDPDTGILYALLKTEVETQAGRRLATLNPVSGVATDIGALPKGFANIEFGPSISTPVPEPSTMILLGPGLAGIIAWRRKSEA